MKAIIFGAVIALGIIGLVICRIVKYKTACKHDWEIIEDKLLMNEDGQFVAQFYVLKCKKCGDLKKQLFRYK